MSRYSCLLQLAGAFNPKWRESLEIETNGEIKDSIDSIVANRNQITHGVHIGLTFNTIKRYYGNAVKFIELIEKISV